MSDPPTAPHGAQRVLVGVDGSERSLRAVDSAADEAARRGAVLEVLHAFGRSRIAAVPGLDDRDDGLRTAAAEVVDAAIQRAEGRAPGLRTVATVRADAGPADALVRAGRDADLTVLGTRGHGGFVGLLVGSVALRVAAHCEGPLLSVAEPRREERGTTLVGLHSGADDAALRYGFEDAARRGAALRVLHAWPLPHMPGRLQLPPHEYTEARDTEAERVREALAPYRKEFPGVRLTAGERGGSPAALLIEASRTADVIVIAVHRRHQRRLGLQLGPVAHAVLHHAHCPVVLVPTAEPANH